MPFGGSARRRGGAEYRRPLPPETEPCKTLPSTGTRFDAIVVGSGASGGWVAKRLCEAGVKVAPLDAGRAHGAGDYSSEIGMREPGWTDNPFHAEFPGCTHPDGHR